MGFGKMRKPVKRSVFGNLVMIFLILLLAAFSALPFIYAILQSIKPLDELFVFPPKFFVNRPTTDNYYLLFQRVQNSWVPFTRYLFNSLFVSVVSTFFHVIVCSMAAFPLAKSKFPFRKAISKIIVLSLLFAGEVTTIPKFILMARTGFIDTYWALILPTIAGSMGLFLMQQFMSQIPDEIIEAGKVDGASLTMILWKIVMPSVKPAWLTLVIFTFQAVWNNTGTTFITNESLKMLPTVLQQITASGISQMGTASAAAVVLMVPPILVYVLTQSSVIETMAQSGIKE